VKDFLGNEIEVGDTIVYPGRASSSLWMNKATVLEVIDPGGLKVEVEVSNYKGEVVGVRKSSVSAVHRVTVVAKA